MLLAFDKHNKLMAEAQEAAGWFTLWLWSFSPWSFTAIGIVFFFSYIMMIMTFAGFDRHLLGLYLIAKEEGLPTPELFMDPLYVKR